jgi:hypothetical protein
MEDGEFRSAGRIQMPFKSKKQQAEETKASESGESQVVNNLREALERAFVIIRSNCDNETVMNFRDKFYHPNLPEQSHSKPTWLTDEVSSMLDIVVSHGWTVWHWPDGSTSGPGETTVISGSYDEEGIRARWKDIRKGIGGETEPFLGLDRLRELAEIYTKEDSTENQS